MMRSRFTIVAILIAVLCLCAARAGTQTVLIVDKESEAGAPLAPPFAVREGLANSLFSDGLIVFDVPLDAAPRSQADLLSLARSAGADYVLQVEVSYDTAADTTPRRVAARATYSATSVRNGASVAHGSLDATNANREKEVDRERLGIELGGLVASEVNSVVGASPAP